MDSLRDNMIGAEELLPLLKERLAAGQTVHYLPFRGCSMLPFLRQERDSVELSPLPVKLKKYDLPVYQYPSGKVVMHRVVKVQEDCYICLGDNTYEYEYVKPEYMIGLVTAFRRGNRRIGMDSMGCLLYARMWVACFPVRKFWKKAVIAIKTWLSPLKHYLLRHLK